MLDEIHASGEFRQEDGKIDFDVTKLKKFKVAELRELCYLHNVDNTGVKAILITKYGSMGCSVFQAGAHCYFRIF